MHAPHRTVTFEPRRSGSPGICARIVAEAAAWSAASVCLGWLSTNLHHVGTYMADADAMVLPLVTVGPADSVSHDWRFLFERSDLLHHCEGIGAATHGLAHLTMLASLAIGSWLLVKMAASRSS